jgi:hypothetical protein
LSTEVRERMELRFKEFAEFQESHFSKLADTESRLIEVIEKLEKRTTDMEGKILEHYTFVSFRDWGLQELTARCQHIEDTRYSDKTGNDTYILGVIEQAEERIAQLESDIPKLMEKGKSELSNRLSELEIKLAGLSTVRVLPTQEVSSFERKLNQFERNVRITGEPVIKSCVKPAFPDAPGAEEIIELAFGWEPTGPAHKLILWGTQWSWYRNGTPARRVAEETELPPPENQRVRPDSEGVYPDNVPGEGSIPWYWQAMPGGGIEAQPLPIPFYHVGARIVPPGKQSALFSKRWYHEGDGKSSGQ